MYKEISAGYGRIEGSKRISQKKASRRRMLSYMGSYGTLI